MATKNTINIDLDVTKTGDDCLLDPVVLRRGENGITDIVLTLYNNGVAFDTTGFTARFMAINADHQFVRSPATASGNKVTYTVKADLTAQPGDVKLAYIELTGSGGLITSSSIPIYILDSVDLSAGQAEEYRNAIDDLMEDLQQYRQTLDDATSQAKDATQKANSAATSATEAAGKASQAATQAEEAARSASSAAEQASQATQEAQGAISDAQAATEDATRAAGEASTAAQQASDAATQATESAGLADDAAQKANDAAGQATQAADDANTAADAANQAQEQASTAAGDASTAAEEARTAAQAATSAKESIEAAAEAGEFDGATFIPDVDVDGYISWTNDKELPNPERRNIKGPQGDKGLQGDEGPQGDPGKDALIVTATATADNTSSDEPSVTVDVGGEPGNQTLTFNFTGLKGPQGDQGLQGPPGLDGNVPIATVDKVGTVKPDGETITITDDGTISVTPIPVEEIDALFTRG